MDVSTTKLPVTNWWLDTRGIRHGPLYIRVDSRLVHAATLLPLHAAVAGRPKYHARLR